ncbi:olfactory receptor 2A12-like [Ursus maritimus]|uniref:Olfactory receptor n=1 Tax=Ursus maritimus TaxID=29073 RepID=A0A384DM71_URSMA|nr:olfactory receptor 2A12-like [Ursus maritimus]
MFSKHISSVHIISLTLTLNMSEENLSTITELVLVGFSNHPQAEIPLFFLFSGVYLVNLFGNTAIIILVLIDSCLQTPMYFFLCHLAFLNIIYTTAVVPKLLFNLLASKKVISYELCIAQTYISLLMGAAECIILSIMALDRYVAICYPLRYLLIMNWSVCVQLAVGAWTISFFASVVPLYFTMLPLCSPYIVDHIFCEAPVLLHMFCADTSLQETMMVIGASGTLLLPFLLITLSYLRILVAVMRMHSSEGRKKAFSVCSSHLTVVTIYYGTGMFMYMRPKSLYSAEGDKLTSLFYAVINPALNPLIYSLRNKEVNEALKRVLERLRQNPRLSEFDKLRLRYPTNIIIYNRVII